MLFDLETDIGETTDVAATNPKAVAHFIHLEISKHGGTTTLTAAKHGGYANISISTLSEIRAIPVLFPSSWISTGKKDRTREMRDQTLISHPPLC